MYPTVFDLEVWSDYQTGKIRCARQQTNVPQSQPRMRIALAHALIALANRLWRPEPIAEAPLPQPS